MNEHDAEKEIYKAMPMPDTSKQPTSQPSMIQLRCTNCGGTMQTEADNRILCCPYCQSKSMIVNESPTDVYKDVEMAKIKSYENLAIEREKMKLEQLEQENKRGYRGLLIYFLIAVGFLIFLLIFTKLF